jgi:hypothetical protein
MPRSSSDPIKTRARVWCKPVINDSLYATLTPRSLREPSCLGVYGLPASDIALQTFNCLL